MAKTQKTKRALLLSGLALLLSVSMLVGSTYAWFTDSVTSASNIIKSGTLDVTMEWADGKEDPATVTWTDASTGAIFNYDLWEPGYTEVRHIKIENEGSLALKYQLKIEANGTVSDLADAIDVYYVDPAQQVADRTVLGPAMMLGTLTDVLEEVPNTAAGSLLPEESVTVTIALKMRETAGNEYQNKSIGTDFSIILTATQLDYEYDSFDKDYDAGLNTPDADGAIMVEKDYIQYVYYQDGTNQLYLVTEDYPYDTVTIPEGVTAIGNYAFAYNSNVKTVELPSTVRDLGRGFDSSTVEKVVLNEGLETISSRAFRSTPNLKEVVIPSTVKTIADNAFQKSGIKEIVIPATVETVGETAFGSSKIETVTFEGNTAIQGYAFRGCPALRTVYLMGDDVTFVPSTLNGRNSMWFCNGESNNPNTSDITFYVENTTVEARVKTAMGAEANNTTIYVDGKLNVTVTTAEELLDKLTTASAGTAINAEGVTLTYAEQFLYVPGGVSVKGMTLITTSRGGTYIVATAGGDEIVFEDCTFIRAETGAEIFGANADGANLVFNNCRFEGPVMPNMVDKPEGTIDFNDCTFVITNDSFIKSGYVNCMGGTHTFTGCVFDYTGGSTSGSNQYVRWNAVNSYSERYSTAVILEGCTFKNCGTQRYGSNSTLTIR